MEILRHQFLQRNIARLFVVVLLFLPLQLSFACELMNGSQSTHCCCMDNAQNGCEHGGGCDNHFPDSLTDKTANSGSNCCTVNLDSSNQNLVSSTYTQSYKFLDTSLQFDWSSVQNYNLIDHNVNNHSRSTEPLYTYNKNKRFTYFHTQRIRI